MLDTSGAHELLNASYVQFAVTALVVYDHFITMGSEINAVWKRQLTVTSALLLSVRYCLLLQAAIPHLATNAMSCNPLMKLSDTLAIIGMLQLSIFSSLRVTALCRGRYSLPAVVFVLGMAPVGTLSFVMAHSHSVLLGPPLDICKHVNDFAPSLATKVVWITRIPMIFADAIVLAVTWTQSFNHYRVAARLRIRMAVTGVLLRDGTVYFIALLALNIAQILTFGRSGAAPVTRLVRLLPLVLVSRFMLNLRQCYSTDLDTDAAHFSRFTVSFSTSLSILGNIGEPLDHGEAGGAEELAEDLVEPTEPPVAAFPGEVYASLSASGWRSIFDSEKSIYADSLPSIQEVCCSDCETQSNVNLG